MSFPVQLPSELEARFDAYCERKGVSREAAPADLIEREICQPAPNAYELAESLGLVGGFDGPDDLATNSRQHLRDRLRARHTG